MRTYRFMKKNSIVFLLGIILAVASCSFTTTKIDPGDNTKEEVLSELITFVLQNYHYSPKAIDDKFSESVYNDYINSLDPRKRFFLASDIEEFTKYKTSIDDELRDHSVDFFTLTYSRLQERMQEMEPVYKEILSKPFDFDKEETINTNYEDADYPSTKKERHERWRKQIKFSVLASYYDLKADQEKVKENKEDEKSSADTKEEDKQPKSDVELEEKARETTRHSLEQFYDLTKDLKKKDWFSIYLNSIAKEFDPHTGYFGPMDKENFDITMSGSLEGIGAQLQKDMDNIKVVKLISGGPAWRQGELKVGDVIKKVKQEDEEAPVSIVGMSINDAVQLIRGPKGSVVTLTIKSVDGTTKTIEITRDVVEIEATYAKSALTTVNGKSYGVIDLPSFYFNMEDYDKRNAATDVKKEIDRLKTQDVNGLVIDLRNNGGGSLSTAIDIAGFFFKKGPVVQVRSGNNQHEVLNDRNASIEWNGPLVILVNELSASASEILSAAMQDYGRAVIIGSEQTYGKGTVQRFLDLNRFMRSDELGDMGSIKITTQKFYRINGGATQLKGVHSDVVAPDRYSFIDIGERDMEAPLPWDEIAPADYQKWNGYTNFDEAIKASQARIDTIKQFDLIRQHAKWIKAQRDKDIYPLSYTAYKSTVEENEKQADRFEKLSKYKTNLSFTSTPQELKVFKTDTTLAEKRERWHKNLSKDVYIEEAIHTLQDLKLSPEQQQKLAKAKE